MVRASSEESESESLSDESSSESFSDSDCSSMDSGGALGLEVPGLPLAAAAAGSAFLGLGFADAPLARGKSDEARYDGYTAAGTPFVETGFFTACGVCVGFCAGVATGTGATSPSSLESSHDSFISAGGGAVSSSLGASQSS